MNSTAESGRHNVEKITQDKNFEFDSNGGDASMLHLVS